MEARTENTTSIERVQEQRWQLPEMSVLYARLCNERLIVVTGGLRLVIKITLTKKKVVQNSSQPESNAGRAKEPPA
jgi:hypothetical protein